MNLAAGTLLQEGKYTIEAVLAEGYLHTTYRAFDRTSGQIVVLKTLSDRLMAKVPPAKWSLLSQEFKNKAKKLFDCRHQHLVKVLEYFTENSAGNSQDFLVMEYIAGPNLGELLKYGHSLTPSQAIHYISQAAIALAALHNKGLLHDQVCPQNMIRQAGTNQIMLTDVNLIDHRFLSTNKISIKHKLTGYSAPELFPELLSELSLENVTITTATDIYSLSASLYSLLSSEIPITAPLRAKKSLTDLHLFHPHLPEAIASTILRGMALQPTERPQTVTLWLKQLTVPKSFHSQTNSEQSHLRSYSMSISSVSDLPKVETASAKQSANFPVTTMPARLVDPNVEPMKQSAVAVINPPTEESIQSINTSEKNLEQSDNFVNLFKKPLWQPPHLPHYAIQILTFLLFLSTSVFSTWLGFTLTLHLRGDRHLQTQGNSSPVNSILRPQDQSTPIFDSLSKEENDQPAFPVRVKTPAVRATPDESLEVLPEDEETPSPSATNEELTPAVDSEQSPEAVLDNPLPENSPSVEPATEPLPDNYSDETVNNSTVPLESPLPTENTLENTIPPDDQGNIPESPAPLETTNSIESETNNIPVSEPLKQLEHLPVATPTVDPTDGVNPENPSPNEYDNSDVNNLPANNILPTEEQTSSENKS